jgi:hypothetical protein
VKHSRTDTGIREYFWSLVDKNGPLPDPATGVRSKCWLWLGSVTDQGFGRFRAGNKTYMATRFAWQEMGKPDPGILTVSTRCGNRLCVRHLRSRTRAAIMVSVSRQGLAFGRAKPSRSHHHQDSPPTSQTLRKGRPHPSDAGRAVRLVDIKCERHPAPSLLETHLAPMSDLKV